MRRHASGDDDGGLSGGSGRWELSGLRDELRDVEDKIRMLSMVTMGDEIGRLAVAGPMRSFTQQRDQLRQELGYPSAYDAATARTRAAVPVAVPSVPPEIEEPDGEAAEVS